MHLQSIGFGSTAGLTFRTDMTFLHASRILSDLCTSQRHHSHLWNVHGGLRPVFSGLA